MILSHASFHIMIWKELCKQTDQSELLISAISSDVVKPVLELLNELYCID